MTLEIVLKKRNNLIIMPLSQILKNTLKILKEQMKSSLIKV